MFFDQRALSELCLKCFLDLMCFLCVLVFLRQ